MSERMNMLGMRPYAQIKGITVRSQAWSRISIIVALDRLRQKDYGFEINNEFG